MRAEHYADELEEALDDALVQDFNLEAEDGSPGEVRGSVHGQPAKHGHPAC